MRAARARRVGVGILGGGRAGELSISEYSFGAIGTLNGALAQADALGIFGWQGVDLATLWDPPKPTDPGSLRVPDVPQLRRPGLGLR